MRKGRLRIRERERESADRFAHNWPIIIENNTRARYIYLYTHTHRCEIIKQTIKMRIRMNIVVVPLLSRWMRRNP